MFLKFSVMLLFGFVFILKTNAQTIESNSDRERMFAFEVKHIDEFMERFNYEKTSLIISYVKTNYPGIAIDQGSLVSNLFNKQNKSLNQPVIDSFSNQVINKEHPVYLDFYSNKWYAEALCKFIYKGKPIDVVLVLKIYQDSLSGGAKWVIVSARSKFIAPVRGQLNVLAQRPGIKFLNPMSHATNFMSLSIALHDKSHIRDYLDTDFLQYPLSKAFLQVILKDQLVYQYVKEVTYHFLQVDGWVFTVNYFNRRSVNSGWLISRLFKATDEEKSEYKNSLLYKSY